MEKLNRLSLYFMGGGLLSLALLIFIPDLYDKKEKKEIETYLQQANEALNQGSYFDAYAIVDIMISKGYRYKETGRDLNKKILTNEIAAIIEEQGDNSAPKLLFTIKERGKYNTDYSGEEYIKQEEKMMFEYAIELATTMGYKQTASLLQNALDNNDKK